ncbi:hypothetical protein BGZ49_003665 [Haplosporangium sp. Z 27]|nr:hypothetical protein BGZ49_003665 [Haplosporangium sp. Z 27]
MKADQQGYLTNITPTTSGGGYDDGYDYEMHSNSDYPRLQEYSGGRLEPTGPYMTATSMSRNHLGFDQNLPRSVYNRPGGDNPTSAGYYSDLDVYSNGIWDQSSHQNQRWTPTPENMYYSDVDQQHNSYIASAQPPVQNQGVPDSPILPSPTFRESGFFGRDSDLFGQNNDLFGQNNDPFGQINNPPPGALPPNSDAPSQLPARTSRDGINNYANEYANNQNMSLRNLRYPE